MPYICVGEENTEELLALIAVNRAGQLYDPTSVEFVVYDWDSGSRVQVYPAIGREDVTGEGTHTGVYPALDIALGSGLIPGTSWGSPNTGKHSIKWWYTDPDGNEVTWEQVFYVEAAGLEYGVWSYVSPTELRAEGASLTALPDSWMMELLKRAHEIIDARCRQPFRPVYQTFLLDGTGSPRLHFPVPIIGIDYIKPNNSTQALDTSSYHVYASPINRKGPVHMAQDPRRNPKVEFIATPSIYSGGSIDRPGMFADGAANQDIGGVFGFLEPDGTTPGPIRRAAMALVYNMATRLTVGGSSGGGSATGALKRLRVDRHEQEWDTAASSVGLTDALAMTPEVEAILKLYRAPIFIGVS